MQIQNAKKKAGRPKKSEATEPKAKKPKAAKVKAPIAAPTEAEQQAPIVYALEPIEERHPWTSEDEVGITLAAIIKCHNAANVLELGTLTGHISKYMMAALPDGGKFTTVDIEDLRHQSTKDAMAGTAHEFILGSSLEVCKGLPKKSFDIIFVDTVHEFDHALPEFKLVEQLIKPGGVMVYHDTIKFEGMAKLVKYAQAFKYNAVTIRTPFDNGLTFIQK
jgi:predicted O-methyltransferase YrrM